MNSERRSAPRPMTRSAGWLFAAMFAGAYALLLVDKLRDYAAQGEELATARERNRIACEIHDRLGHYLTTIHMQIQAARAILDTNRSRADQTLAKAQQLSQVEVPA